MLVYAARRHAMVRRLDDDADASGLENVLNRIGNLCGHLFLDLKTLGVDVNHARELADADDPTTRYISDPGSADDWSEVVLAMTFKWNAAQHHHLIVVFDLLECFLQDKCRILRVTREVLFEGARDACWRFGKPFPIGIVARPANYRSERGFNFAAIWFAVCYACALCQIRWF